MLLDTQPVIVVDLIFSKSSLVLTVQVKHGLVLSTELRLRVRVLVVSEVHLGLSGLITSVLGINVRLCRLVQTLQELLVGYILPLLFVHVLLIFAEVLVII